MANFETWEAKDGIGTPTTDFRITREGQRDVTGAVWLPEPLNNETALICFGHGASGDRYQPPVSDLAARFIAAGMPVLSLDGPDHGLRQTGEGGRAGMFADMTRPTCLDDMAGDWDCAIDNVQSHLGINAQKLGYFGLSMGTLFGIPLLAHRKDIAVATLGLWGAMDGVPHNDDLVAQAEKLSLPLLFLMQTNDEFWSIETYHRLFGAFGSTHKSLHGNPGVHAEIPADEVRFAADFMLSVLSGRAFASSREMVQIVDSSGE